MPTIQSIPERESRFRTIVESTESDILAYALRRVSRPEDAADVVSETYLVAWRRIEEVPEGEAARLWLFGVARRQLANLRRGQDRQRNLSERLRGELVAAMPAEPGSSDREVEIIEAMARLSDDDREILTLHAWEDLGPSEIARVMGLRRPTTRSRLHRAMKRLRNELGEADSRVPAGSAPNSNPEAES